MSDKRTCYDLKDDDTIRIRRKFRHTARFVDGARIGDLPRHGVLSLLREGRIEVRRNGKKVRPRGWTAPQRRTKNGGTLDPWAPRRLRCIDCDASFRAEDMGDRVCVACLAGRDAETK